MSKNNDEYKYQQENLGDHDYYLELHKLLNPDLSKKIFSYNAQKLDNIIKLKELYSYVYSANAYTTSMSTLDKSRMSSKITVMEAKELCEFINSLDLNNTSQNKLINEEEIDKNNKEKTIKLHTGKLAYLKKAKKNNTKKSKNINAKKIYKLTEISPENAKSKLEKTLIIKKNKIIRELNVKKTTVDINKINEVSKRDKGIEEDSFVPSKKPAFVNQVSSVKKSKVSINLFKFHENDEIKISPDDKRKETKIELSSFVDEKEIKNPIDNEIISKIPYRNLEVNSKIKYSKNNDVIKEKVVFSYKENKPTVLENNIKTKASKKISKKNK